MLKGNTAFLLKANEKISNNNNAPEQQLGKKADKHMHTTLKTSSKIIAPNTKCSLTSNKFLKFVFLFIQFFRDVAWERDILSLRVKCKMNERGCDWKGQLRHYEVMCSCVFAFFWLTDCPAGVDLAISYIKACLALVKICIICDRDYCLCPETLGCTPFRLDTLDICRFQFMHHTVWNQFMQSKSIIEKFLV